MFLIRMLLRSEERPRKIWEHFDKYHFNTASFNAAKYKAILCTTLAETKSLQMTSCNKLDRNRLVAT